MSTTKNLGAFLYTLAVAAAWAAILTLLLRGTAIAADSSPFASLTTGINTAIREIKPLLIAGGGAAVMGAGLAWHFSDKHMKKLLASGLGSVFIGLFGQTLVTWLQTTFGGTPPTTPAGG